MLISGFGVTAPLPGDRVGVFGDVTTSTGQPVARTLIYDSIQNRWSEGAPIPEPRFGETAVALDDGEVLFAGGFGAGTESPPPALNTTYLYDAARDSWGRVGDLNVPRAGAQAAVLSDGRLLVVGGADSPSAERFDPATSLWSRVGSPDQAQPGAILAPLPNGKAILAGGCIGQGVFGQQPRATGIAEAFDDSSGTWRPVKAMPQARCNASGVALSDGRVLVIGGSAQVGTSLEDAVIFDPKSETWTPAGQIASVGSPLSSQPLPVTILSNHRVFVPMAETGQRSGALTSVVVGGQLYDPVSGSWSFVTSTSAETSLRFGLPQVVSTEPLHSNRVLVLLENSALIFDADASPPPAAVLGSSSLTVLLLALTLGLSIAIAIAYTRGRLRKGASGRLTG